MKEVNATVIIPTINEAENLRVLLQKLPQDVRVLMVDDGSTDGTPEVARSLGAKVIRGDNRGLTPAILKGIKHAETEKVIIMDADMQHPPEVIPQLIYQLSIHDIVIGSRYCRGGKAPGFTWLRGLMSRTACWLSYPFLTRVEDNMSGFFGLRRKVLTHRICEDAPKLLLEVLVKGNHYSAVELPIIFGPRHMGESKFYQLGTIWAVAKQILWLYWHKVRPLTIFVAIALVVAALVFGGAYILTEWFKLWYMLSFLFMSGLGLLAKFVLEKFLVFSEPKDPDDGDYEWHAWFKGNPVQRMWKRKIGSVVQEFAEPLYEDTKILDIGCGSSPISARLNCWVLGIDTNPEKIEFLRSHSPGHHCYQVGDALTYPLDQGAFDLVICSEMIEHVQEPKKLVERIASVLKPSGKAIMATPDKRKLLWRLAKNSTPYSEQHTCEFTREELETLCNRYGMSLVRHKWVFGCDFVGLFQKVR